MRKRAEAAANAAQLGAEGASASVGRYLSTADGLADTSEGDTFWVVDGPDYITLYRHDSGPTATALDASLPLRGVTDLQDALREVVVEQLDASLTRPEFDPADADVEPIIRTSDGYTVAALDYVAGVVELMGLRASVDGVLDDGFSVASSDGYVLLDVQASGAGHHPGPGPDRRPRHRWHFRNHG